MTARAGTMTGPEHYREAEACIAHAERHMPMDSFAAADYASRLAVAHATLALAAATALPIVLERDGVSAAEWGAVVVPKRRQTNDDE